jgi:hypothetical protein
LVLALRLAKGGWWGGDPEKVMEAPVDAVLEAAAYESFQAEYESELIRLNKPEAE